MVRSLFMARLFAALAFITALFAPIASGDRVAAQGRVDAIDLPAIVFTSADLAEFGFEGYVVDSAGPYDLVADAEYISDSQQLDYAEVEEVFTDAGHQGSYVMLYKLPADPDDPGGPPMREIQTSAYLFADADGAEAAYEVIADESNSGGADIDNAGLGIGDESELTTQASSADANYGLPNTQIELEILFDRLVLEVSTYNYDPETAGMPIFEPDEMEIVEALGERLVERAEAALEGETPNLSPMVMLIDGTLPYSTYLTYELLDGAGIQPWFQTIEAFEERVEMRLDGGMIAAVRTEQVLSEPAEDGSSIRFFASLQIFERERDAGAYLEETLQRVTEDERYISVETEELPGLGDLAIGVTIESENDAGDEVAVNQLFLQVGSVIAVVWIDGPAVEPGQPIVSFDALTELGDAQVVCIEAGACDGLVAMPDELAALTGGAGSGTDDEDDAGDEVDDADADEQAAEGGEVYESPQYGYTLTYDPGVWEISAEDNDPDDEYDRVTLQTDEGFVGIIGDPDYRPSQLDDCVADYQAGLEQGDDVDNVRAMRGEAGEEDDRAWAAVTYDLLGEDDEEPLEVARYIECRAYDDVTIVILQTSLEVDYDDLSAAREELVEGID